MTVVCHVIDAGKMAVSPAKSAAWSVWPLESGASLDCLGPLIVGFALVLEASGGRGRRFSLAWLLVHPAVRRQGVAMALLSAAVAHVRSQGGAKIHVDTLSSWPDAVAFWRSVTA